MCWRTSGDLHPCADAAAPQHRRTRRVREVRRRRRPGAWPIARPISPSQAGRASCSATSRAKRLAREGAAMGAAEADNPGAEVMASQTAWADRQPAGRSRRRDHPADPGHAACRSAPPSRVDRVVPACASGVGAGRCGPHRRRVRAASAQSAGVGGVRVPHWCSRRPCIRRTGARPHQQPLRHLCRARRPSLDGRVDGRADGRPRSWGCGPAWSRASTAPTRRGSGRPGWTRAPARASWAGRGRSWIRLGLSRLTRDGRVDAAALDVLWSGWRESARGRTC